MSFYYLTNENIFERIKTYEFWLDNLLLEEYNNIKLKNL